MPKEPLTELAGQFGARLRARRTELGWSQEQLGAASGMHWSFISQIERGQRHPGLQVIVRLGEALQMDPGDLIHGLRSS